MESLAVVVPREKAEEVRQRLIAMGVFRTGVAVDRAGETIYLPVTQAVNVGHRLEHRTFRESYAPIRQYKDIANVPDTLRSLLPTSFDVVGDVAVIRIPEALQAYAGEIAAAVLRANTALRVVAGDSGVKGEHRVRELRILAGPRRTDTTHREFGLSYRVDLARAYFSPRLGTERMRVAEQVHPGEAVADLFAGVGPYAILIARRRRPRVVYAFDANPEAFQYLQENTRRNRADRVEPRLGDALGLINEIEPVDRAIIDYPQDPDPALRAVLPRMLPNGVVHYYVRLETLELEGREDAIREVARAADRDAEVLGRRQVHGWSPTQKVYAFDVRVV